MDNVLCNDRIDLRFESTKNILKSIKSALYYFSLICFLLHRLLFNVTVWSNHFYKFAVFRESFRDYYINDLYLIIFACIIISFFVYKPNIPLILFFATLIFSGKQMYIHNEDVYMYLVMLLLVAAYKEDCRKIFIVVLTYNLSSLLITVIASQTGVIENIIELGRDREFLGYTWTTTPVMIFAYSVFMYGVLRKGKFNIFEYSIISVINVWFFIKTNTRFAFLIVFLYLFCIWLTNNTIDLKGRLVLILERSAVALPWICFAFIYGISMAFDENNSVMVTLNRLLSNRLRQCQYSILKYGLLPWGQPITWVKTTSATADNPATYVDTAYLQTLLKFGFMSIILLLAVYSYCLYKSFKKKNYIFALAFLTVMVFGLTEQQMFWFEYDVLFMVAFANWDNLTRSRSNRVKPSPVCHENEQSESTV